MIYVYFSISLIMTIVLMIGMKKNLGLNKRPVTVANICLVLLMGPCMLPYYIRRILPYWKSKYRVNYPDFMYNHSQFVKPNFPTHTIEKKAPRKKVYDFTSPKTYDFSSEDDK